MCEWIVKFLIAFPFYFLFLVNFFATLWLPCFRYYHFISTLYSIEMMHISHVHDKRLIQPHQDEKEEKRKEMKWNEKEWSREREKSSVGSCSVQSIIACFLQLHSIRNRDYVFPVKYSKSKSKSYSKSESKRDMWKPNRRTTLCCALDLTFAAIVSRALLAL